MGMHYGTPVPRTIDGPQLAAAESQALCHTVAGFDYLWRIEAVRYSGCEIDQFGGENYYLTDPRLELFAVSVKKWTPTGARLWSGRHVDLRDRAKQYASRTVVEALEQFKRRREAQIWILERQLRRAKTELRLCGPDPLGCLAPAAL